MADDTIRGHKNARNDLTAEYVREILHYDPETGVFTWRKTLSRRAVAGKRAGYKKTPGKKQRWAIGILDKEYYTCRLAWLYMTNKWPEFEIDHKDTDSLNDKWSNLRPATSSENIYNRASRNPTGFRGVSPHKEKFIAKITKQGKQIYLGIFDTAEDAANAYNKAAENIYGDFARDT